MGKRSDFKRRPMDAYQTIDPRAVAALLPFIEGLSYFAEPCRGEGHLERQLNDAGLTCLWSSDIADTDPPLDALTLTAKDLAAVDAIITNPPWSRPILHEMIRHFQSIAPTWLLFDADWAHTKQAAPYLPQCSHIVSVGRLKWIEGSKHTGKDNCAWYRFDTRHSEGPRFYGPVMAVAA
ncbi:MAG: hypothetical protein WBA88_16015 [Pseudaminobacter sp.]